MNLKNSPKLGQLLGLTIVPTNIKRFWTVLLHPTTWIPAMRGNYKAWISKQYASHNENKTKYDYIKSTAEILSNCPNSCSYEMQCCGCSIYAAVEENKQCKWKTTKK